MLFVHLRICIFISLHWLLLMQGISCSVLLRVNRRLVFRKKPLMSTHCFLFLRDHCTELRAMPCCDAWPPIAASIFHPFLLPQLFPSSHVAHVRRANLGSGSTSRRTWCGPTNPKAQLSSSVLQKQSLPYLLQEANGLSQAATGHLVTVPETMPRRSQASLLWRTNPWTK